MRYVLSLSLSLSSLPAYPGCPGVIPVSLGVLPANPGIPLASPGVLARVEGIESKSKLRVPYASVGVTCEADLPT